MDENNNVVKQYERVNNVETNVIEFVYDSSDTPIYFTYNNATYYYEKNLQGDIVAILDSNGGNTVVQYTYDIWGKLLNTTGTLASTIGVTNPLRYRGYYYDTETELYYLQSRYYSPDLMGFISQDDVVLSNDQGEPLGSNLYAYCLNNPVNFSDRTGKLPLWAKITIGIAGIAASVALTVATGGAALPALVASLKAVVGNMAISVALSGLIGYLTSGYSGLKKVLKEGLADGFMWGGIGSAMLAATEAIKFGGKMVVYTSKAANGTTQYVGITNDLARRSAEHLAKKGIQIQRLMKGLNPKCARAVEQCLIEYYGLMKNGGTLINKINSIAKTNKIYAQSLKLGWYLLKRAGFKG